MKTEKEIKLIAQLLDLKEEILNKKITISTKGIQNAELSLINKIIEIIKEQQMKPIMKIESDGVRTTLELIGMKIPIREIEFYQGIDELATLKVDIVITMIENVNKKENNENK